MRWLSAGLLSLFLLSCVTHPNAQDHRAISIGALGVALLGAAFGQKSKISDPPGTFCMSKTGPIVSKYSHCPYGNEDLGYDALFASLMKEEYGLQNGYYPTKDDKAIEAIALFFKPPYGDTPNRHGKYWTALLKEIRSDVTEQHQD